MNIEKTYLVDKLNCFENSAKSHKLPSWDELPNIDLYMDQVIFLLNQYLSRDDSCAITQSMINNYVKQKAIPAPVKKRYSKVHLAYLIIFCTLKQILSIADIQNILPADLSEDDVRKMYSSFLDNRQKSLEYSVAHTKKITEEIFASDKDEFHQTSDIVMMISNIANVFKMLTEDIISEKEYTEEEEV